MLVIKSAPAACTHANDPSGHQDAGIVRKTRGAGAKHRGETAREGRRSLLRILAAVSRQRVVMQAACKRARTRLCMLATLLTNSFCTSRADAGCTSCKEATSHGGGRCQRWRSAQERRRERAARGAHAALLALSTKQILPVKRHLSAPVMALTCVGLGLGLGLAAHPLLRRSHALSPVLPTTYGRGPAPRQARAASVFACAAARWPERRCARRGSAPC